MVIGGCGRARAGEPPGAAAALTPEEAAELLDGAPWRRVALLGDSAADGVREPVAGYPDMAWLDWVSMALAANAPDTVCLNLGRGGALAADVRAEQLDAALAFEPDLVTVSVGGSDLAEGSFDVDAVEAEIDTVVTALRTTGATVMAVSPFGVTGAWPMPQTHAQTARERLRTLAARTAAVADSRGALFIDYGMYLAHANPRIWGSDGVHLNGCGHAVAGSVAVRLLAGHLRWAATLRR